MYLGKNPTEVNGTAMVFYSMTT